MKLRARSNTAKAACPSLSWQTSGCSPRVTQQAPAADAEHDLLEQAQLRAAAVELAGDAPQGRRIRGVVRVEQVECGAANLHLPGADPRLIAGQHDLESHPLAVLIAHRRDGQLARIVIRVERHLGSLRIEHLAEVALLVQEPHADHRDTQVARRLELVAGDVPKSPRVDGQRFAEHELHAEIGHARSAAHRHAGVGTTSAPANIAAGRAPAPRPSDGTWGRRPGP